ncbi:hypothetical protein BZA70DRAFT_273415, partial [Myxozyma melibiosi]
MNFLRASPARLAMRPASSLLRLPTVAISWQLPLLNSFSTTTCTLLQSTAPSPFNSTGLSSPMKSSVLHTSRSQPLSLPARPKTSGLPVMGLARYYASGPTPTGMFPFKDLFKVLLSMIPLPIRVGLGIFSVAGFVLIAMYPTILLYLPLLLVPYLIYRRRQNILRDRAFRRAWDDLVGETAADTTASRVSAYTSEQLVAMVNDRLHVALRENAEYLRTELGLLNPKQLELGACENIDREVEDVQGQVAITTVLDFGLVSQESMQRVADVQAVIKSAMYEKVWEERPSETTSMKVTVTSNSGKAWEIFGVTHEDDAQHSKVIDIKPKSVRD